MEKKRDTSQTEDGFTASEAAELLKILLDIPAFLKKCRLEDALEDALRGKGFYLTIGGKTIAEIG